MVSLICEAGQKEKKDSRLSKGLNITNSALVSFFAHKKGIFIQKPAKNSNLS